MIFYKNDAGGKFGESSCVKNYYFLENILFLLFLEKNLKFYSFWEF